MSPSAPERDERRARAVRGLCWSLLAAALLACGDGGGPGGGGGEASGPSATLDGDEPFPLRLLAEPADDLGESFEREDFALTPEPAPGRWWSRGSDGEPAPLDGAVGRVSQGALRVPGPAVVVRRLDLPPGPEAVVELVLGAASRGLVAGMTVVPRDDAPAGVLAPGTPVTGRLVDADPSTGRLDAEVLVPLSDSPRAVELVLPVPEGELVLHELRVHPIASPVANNVNRQRGASGGDGAIVLTLRGDRRLALRVPPEAAVVRPVTVPPGARRLTFAVTGPRDAPPGWSVEFRQQGESVGAAGGAAPTGPASAGEVVFHEQSVAWPEGLAGDVELVFRGRGRNLAFAEPVIRGPARRERPDVLLVVLDTLRADRLGFMGYDRPTSPFLDRFAEGAAVFDRHHSVSSYTLPTHASLFTGLHPLRHGTLRLHQRVASDELEWLPQRLADGGYATAAWAGGGYVSEDFGFARGFDRFRTDDAVARTVYGRPEGREGLEAATAWLEERGDEPWFLFLHTYTVHDYSPPKDLLELFDRHPDAPWSQDRVGHAHADWTLPGNEPTPADVAHMSDAYDATIRAVDRELEALLGAWREGGLLDEAVVLITSDHGEEFWEHGGLLHGVTLYEEQLHVPLLVDMPERGPAASSRTGRVSAPTSVLDLAPTVLDLAGLPGLGDGDGRSLGPFLRGESGPPAPAPFLAHLDVRSSSRRALLTGRHKLLWGDTSDAVPMPARRTWELFDLSVDPTETADVLDQDGERAAALMALLEGLELALERDGRAADDADLSEEVKAQLRELGYLK